MARTDLRRLVEELGFVLVRRTGTGHWLYKHRANGARLVVSDTPSDRLVEKRVLSQARRLARGEPYGH